VVQGYVEAIHFFKTKRSEVLPLLQQFLMFKDRTVVEEAYGFYAPLLQRSPRPSERGLRTLLQDLRHTQPSAVSLSPTDIVDSSFLDELERAGFIERIYGE
jgi:hypothetical protein